MGAAVDRDLVERAQRGDASAFESLLDRTGDRLYAAAFGVLRDSERADDAVQQAMIDIWRRLPTLRDPDRFLAWAYRIVIRAAYAEVRQRRRWGAAGGVTEIGLRSVPDHAAAIVDRDQLDRGLDRLGMDHRAVIVLKHLAGLSNPEIAHVLGIPEGTVRSRLHHSMNGLRAALEADARARERGA
jgi:RNA polymerase sigma-70 factor (ECF subfamily)